MGALWDYLGSITINKSHHRAYWVTEFLTTNLHKFSLIFFFKYLFSEGSFYSTGMFIKFYSCRLV